MVGRVTIKIGLLDPKSLERVRALMQQESLRKEFGRVFGLLGNQVARGIILDLRQSKRVRRRTGALSNSVRSEAFRTEAGFPAIRVGSIRGPAYARIQEEGGEITPKKAKALTIPLAPVLTAAGVARRSARDYNLKFVPFRKSGVAIGALYPPEELRKAQLKARASKQPVSLRDAKAYFLLVRKVKLPARRWLSGSFDDQLPEMVSGLAKFAAEILTARFQGRTR